MYTQVWNLGLKHVQCTVLKLWLDLRCYILWRQHVQQAVCIKPL